MAIGGPPPLSAALVEAAVRHVRLAYHYLDQDDLDAFGSLLTDRVRVDHPDLPPGRGRDEVLELLQRVAAGRHRLLRIIAAPDQIAVHGTFVPRQPADRALGPAPVEFAEFFDLSRDGLLVACRRFYDAAPETGPGPAPARRRGGKRRDKSGIGRGGRLNAIPPPPPEAEDDGRAQ